MGVTARISAFLTDGGPSSRAEAKVKAARDQLDPGVAAETAKFLDQEMGYIFGEEGCYGEIDPVEFSPERLEIFAYKLADHLSNGGSLIVQGKE